VEIELASSYVDAANGIDKDVGDVVDLPDEIAMRLVDRGSAIPVAGPPATRRTTRKTSAPEKRAG
jgi:hypothetical protein